MSFQYFHAYLLLLLLNVWLIHCFPVEESNPDSSRLQRSRLKYDHQKLRFLPNQRTSTRRTHEEEDLDAQKKLLQDVGRLSERISRTRAQPKQKYLYQTEANINRNIHYETLSLNKHRSETDDKSESSLAPRQTVSNNNESDEVTKIREIKESILKSNTKTKIKLLENRERNGNRRLQISLPSNDDRQTSQNARPQSVQPVPKRPSFTNAIPILGNEEEIHSEERNPAKENRQTHVNSFPVPNTEEESSNGDRKAKGTALGYSGLSPFSEKQHGLSNRHKKHPFGQGVFTQGSSYTLKTTFEGKETGPSIVQEEWRGEDVLRDVSSEAQKGFPKTSKEISEFEATENYERNKQFDREPRPAVVQPVQNSQIKHFPEEPRKINTHSFISSRPRAGPTSTTPRTEDWSAESARYSFSSNQEDRISDLLHDRTETREGGTVRGKYSYSDGFVLRTVEYIADKDGYRIVNELSTPLSAEGPMTNPDGHAAVRTDVDGHAYDYIVHGHELPRRRSYKRMRVIEDEE